MRLRDRWREVRRIWSGNSQEIRHTAVGWQPDESYQEDCKRTPSGEREFYKVIRPINKKVKP